MHTRKVASVLSVLLCLAAPKAWGQEALTWQDCLAEAKKNNPELVSAVAGIDQTKAARDITASSLYPQITADVSASTARTDSGSESSTTDSYSYGLAGSQLIFDGLKTLNDVDAARQIEKGARQNYRFVSSGVRQQLRSAFVNLLKAQELVRVTEGIVKIRRDNLVMISLRYQSGLEHRGALLIAEADLAGAQFDLSRSRRSVEFAQRQLNKQMGRKNFEPFIARGDFLVRDTAEDKPDFDAIAKNHPSVLEATAATNAASFGVKSAFGNFSPQVTAAVEANKRSASWPPEDDQWRVGLGVTMPIFEGGLQFAELSAARATYLKAQADERNTHDTVVVTLEQTWAQLRDAAESVGVAQKNLEATEEREKIASSQYATGFINFDDWIIIENSLVLAKKTYLEAQASALLAEANWIQAKGETLEYAL